VVFIPLSQEMTGKSVILLPVGAGDDGAHSQNEKINIRNYIEGVTKLLVNHYWPFVGSQLSVSMCHTSAMPYVWPVTAVSHC
jgi:hypothetical protein